jgi:hypothetical protein
MVLAHAQPKRIENARILVANTGLDTDKIKIYGARVRVDALSKVRVYHPRSTILCTVWKCKLLMMKLYLGRL